MPLQSAPPPHRHIGKGKSSLDFFLSQECPGWAGGSQSLDETDKFLQGRSQGLLGLDVALLWPPTLWYPTESWGFPYIPGLLAGPLGDAWHHRASSSSSQVFLRAKEKVQGTFFQQRKLRYNPQGGDLFIRAVELFSEYLVTIPGFSRPPPLFPPASILFVELY